MPAKINAALTSGKSRGRSVQRLAECRTQRKDQQKPLCSLVQPLVFALSCIGLARRLQAQRWRTTLWPCFLARVSSRCPSLSCYTRPGATARRLTGVQIFSRDGQGRIERRISAAEAAYDGPSGWTLSGVEVSRFSSDMIERSRLDRSAWKASLLPTDVAAFIAAVPTISAEAARRSLAQAAPVDRAETVFATRVQRSVAEPLAPVVMLLLALPLAFVPPRTGRSWPALLYAGVAGLVYMVADGVLTVAAQVGYVPSVLGAWAAPVLAGLIGLTVLLFSER